MRYVGELKKEGLLLLERQANLKLVAAARENPHFIRLKRLYNLEVLYESGLVDFLMERCHHPLAITCFGSFSRGEDLERSDVDIAIIGASEREIPLDKFSRRINKEISVHFVEMDNISKEFAANIHNGVVLEGTI